MKCEQLQNSCLPRYQGYFSGKSFQSISVLPILLRHSFAREKCLQPMNPLCAESGEGWTDFKTLCFLVLMKEPFFWASFPHRRKTRPCLCSFNQWITASVNFSHPYSRKSSQAVTYIHRSCLVCMRLWLLMTHSETGVEQQHSLSGPAHQVTVCRPLKALHVTLQLFVHIEQAGWGRHTQLHTETHAMSLPWTVVRVLAENHHLDLHHKNFKFAG